MMNPRQNRDMPFHMFPANTHNPFKRSMISLWYWQINPTIVQMVRNKRIEDNRLDLSEKSRETDQDEGKNKDSITLIVSL